MQVFDIEARVVERLRALFGFLPCVREFLIDRGGKLEGLHGVCKSALQLKNRVLRLLVRELRCDRENHLLHLVREGCDVPLYLLDALMTQVADAVRDLAQFINSVDLHIDGLEE